MRIGTLFLLLFVFPLMSFAEAIPYPRNQVERPLTLPDNIGEVGIGIGYLQWDGTSSDAIYPVLSLRYGVTDNLEFNLVGLKYRISGENKPVEMIIKGRMIGLGHSSINGTFLLSEIGAEGKQRLDSTFAILYRIEDYYGYYSKNTNINDIRFSLGGLLSVTDRLALDFVGTYRKLSGFETSDAWLYKITVYYNITQNLDILIEGAISDFSENEDLRYLSDSFKRAYGLRLNWRF
ncbi:MAG: hypothetical protein HY753_02740 [Nitrospirae bacterium]|nr:hypothetical protein [Nitrospirota bacterium]